MTHFTPTTNKWPVKLPRETTAVQFTSFQILYCQSTGATDEVVLHQQKTKDHSGRTEHHVLVSPVIAEIRKRTQNAK